MQRTLRRLRLALFVLACASLLAGAQPATAQTASQCAPNGCGPSGWLGTVIPDRFADCTFKAACDGHDECYSRCESCGPLFGTQACEGNCEQKRDRKERCDTDFYDRMVSDNQGRTHCRLAAKAYYMAVSYRGCAYFRSLRDPRPTREKIQSDFESILKYLEENPEPAQQDAAARTLRSVSRLEASERNRVGTAGGRLTLEAEAATRSASRTTRSSRPATDQVLLNGIDVSRMVVDGKPFELGEIRNERKDIDLQDLEQQVIRSR